MGGDRWHHMTQVTAVTEMMIVMTDPRMISGLKMLSSDEPSSEHSRVTGGSSVVTVITDVTPEPGHSSLSSSHVRLSVSAAELHTGSGLGQVPVVSGCLLSSQSLTHSSQLSQLSLTKTRGSWCLVSLRTQLQPPEPSLQPLPSPAPACGHSQRFGPSQLSVECDHPSWRASTLSEDFKILHTWQ